ncbi:hypothetical protein HDIA_0051 [Hartmannibacter diazotrophicus]|uniref:DUF302 domain-containing protein n=1 Tax=Hartmannibacter diazotrophicus TaxID=1482074 RepID=A0A2C9CZS7_9HYPH|nr:DUF302 domain-containing protein [Hartmannibacter diazotrophicus]SON53592.1 hypothetical protein HDIA_0051 [Hartmannibacter diazotrophicus]
MSYHFTTTLNQPFEQAVETVTAALKEKGFGVLTTIDVKATLKAKIGAEFRPYVILGACNPGFAFKALQAEPKIGTMLPCNVVVEEKGDHVEVSAIDPMASMQAVDNPALGAVATEVRDLLKSVVDDLAAKAKAA